jgi:hypothetical protein
MAIETIKSEDVQVGCSFTTDKTTFDRLLKMLGGAPPTMESWSKTLTTLINKGYKP